MDSITFSDDAVAHVPLKWADSIGSVPPPADASVVSSNTAVCTVALENSGAGLAITPVSDGGATVSISGNAGAATDSVTVTITAPSATSVSADTAHATFTPKT